MTPTAGLNTRFQQLNFDESNRGAAVSNGGTGVVDLAQFFQSAEGWTAFTVTPVAAPATATETFDLNVASSAAVTYTRTAGTTAFSDACVGGTVVASNDATNDEGFSAVIAPPAGFDFFGFSTSGFLVNTNGFLSFDTSLTCASIGGSCFFGNLTMPNVGNPNGIVAPYWDDLIATVCQKTIGTTLVIQWTGRTFASATQLVSAQAILDGSNDTIEFVYGPTQNQTGQSGTVGIENQVGGAASHVGTNTAGTITVGTSILFTPM